MVFGRNIGGLPSAARRRRCAPAPFQPSLRLRFTVSARRPQTEACKDFQTNIQPVADRRQTAVFRTGLHRWFLRNLLKTADCRRHYKPESVRFGIASLLYASQPRPTFARPLVACASFRSATPNPVDTGNEVK